MDILLEDKIKQLEAIVDKFKHYVEKPRLKYVKTKAPYYREKYAVQLKIIIDEMVKDRQDRIILFSDYKHLSKHSLYNRINQSFQFLVNELDQNYADIRAEIRIKAESAGVRLSFYKAEELIASIPEEEKKVDPVVSKIQTIVSEFIANKDQHFFLCKEINLNSNQLVEVTEILNSHKTTKILYNVSRKSIRIVKVLELNKSIQDGKS